MWSPAKGGDFRVVCRTLRRLAPKRDFVDLESDQPFRSGGGVFDLYAQDATGHCFARHNGLMQEDIPLEASLELRSMVSTNGGGMDVLGVDTKTNSKVRSDQAGRDGADGDRRRD